MGIVGGCHGEVLFFFFFGGVMVSFIIAAKRQDAELCAKKHRIKDWRFVYDIECIRGIRPYNNTLIIDDSWEHSNMAKMTVGLLRMDPGWRETIEAQM